MEWKYCQQMDKEIKQETENNKYKITEALCLFL